MLCPEAYASLYGEKCTIELFLEKHPAPVPVEL